MYAKFSYILNSVMEIHARFTAAEILGWIVGWIVPTGPGVAEFGRVLKDVAYVGREVCFGGWGI
jgi:hypothetical protein